MKEQSVLFIVITLFIVFFLISKLLGIEMATGKKGRNEVCKKGECDTKFECRERKDGKEKGFFCLPRPKPKPK